MKIVFFGTSLFSVTILQHVLPSVIAIVTKQDQPQGRSLRLTPPPVKEWAQLHAPHIPLYQPHRASSEEFVACMRELSPDLFVVASYGEIMKTPLLEVPRLAPINVHASLLPKWRGAAPIQRALMAGETESGVTIMKMVLQLDAGDILDQVKVPITPNMTHGELEHALALASEEPLLRVIRQFQEGAVHAEPQDSSLVTFAAKITPSETEIDWSKAAFQVHNQIRALSPSPGAWTWVEVSGQKKKMKIKRSKLASNTSSTPKQTIAFNSKEWVVGCGQGGLSLIEVQLEGKKSLSIGDFLRGLQHPPSIPSSP